MGMKLDYAAFTHWRWWLSVEALMAATSHCAPVLVFLPAQELT
jgi:hypothetical protein